MKNGKKKNDKKTKLIKNLGLVCAFIIAIGATFGITLAWFGGNASSNTTITLRGGVTVGSAIESSAGALVVPGQAVTVTATPTVTIVASNPTPALLRAEFTFGGTAGAVTTTISAAAISSVAKWNFANGANGSAANAYWVKNGDYYYLCTSVAANPVTDTPLFAIGATTNKAVMSGSFTVPDSLVNSDANKTFTATVKFVAVQAIVPGANGAILGESSLTIGNSYVNTIFTAVNGY